MSLIWPSVPFGRLFCCPEMKSIDPSRPCPVWVCLFCCPVLYEKYHRRGQRMNSIINIVTMNNDIE